MINKSSILVLAVLLSLPGCGWGKKGKEKKGRTNAVAQNADQFKTVNMALAEQGDLAGIEVDESMRSFFNDMEEFVSFAQEGGDFSLVEADEAIKRDEFAWKDAQTGEFATIYFGFNQDKIDKDEKAKVSKNVQKAKDLLANAGTDAKIVVEGHACASAGSDAYNMALSERRAKEITDQLVSSGVSPDQIKTVGRGNEILLVKEGGREEQWPNRRVEIHVINS